MFRPVVRTVAALVVALPAFSATLDPMFGTNGAVTYQHGPAAENSTSGAVKVGTLGRIYTGGSTFGNQQGAGTRLLATGTADMTFTVPPPAWTIAGYSPMRDVHPLADGGTLAIGSYLTALGQGTGNPNTYASYVARFDDAGAPVATFGTNGFVPLKDIYGENTAVAILGLADGRFYAVTTARLGRHLADGSVDPGYALETLAFEATDAVLQADGSVVVFGIDRAEPDAPQFALARYDASGTANLGFSFEPPVPFGSSAPSGAVFANLRGAVQSDGRIVVGGANTDGTGFAMRFLANGAADTDFGVVGTSAPTMGRRKFSGPVRDIEIMPDDRIVMLVGSRGLVRIDAEGFHDPTFEGFELPTDAIIARIALQSDGKVIASGVGGSVAAGAQEVYTARVASDTPASFSLSSTGTSFPFGAFGYQSVGTSSPPQAVNVTNVSGIPQPVAVSVTHAAFELEHDCPATLAAGATCTASVEFAPEPTLFESLDEQLRITNGVETLAVGLTGTPEHALVTHFYRTILGREPDEGGRAYWTGLQNLDLAGRGESSFAMAQAFFSSLEYQSVTRTDTAYVTDLYATFFDRAPDSGGLAYWLEQLAGGMPREGVLVSFMFSPEFTAFVDTNLGNAGSRPENDMTMDFYRGLLSRYADVDGFNYWLRRFRIAQCSGADAVAAEADVISSGFLSSPEYAARQRNDVGYVVDLYNAFLRRGPDLAGLQFWVDRIASGTSRDEVRRLFMSSPEFSARVQAVVAATCLPQT